jgi:hypothetical protein
MDNLSLKYLIEAIESHQLDEMAGISTKASGLPFKLWVPHHGMSNHFLPYVKVFGVGNKELVSVSIKAPVKILVGDASSLSGKDWKKVVEFIDLNRDVLMDFYQHAAEPDFDDVERFYSRIKKVL